MSSEILNAIQVSASGMRAQGSRIRVITENVANAGTTASEPGANPYSRQTISFTNELDKASGVKKVEVNEIGRDQKTPFPTKYMPDHPAANEEGYVKMPNVNMMLEMMDMKEAQRSYEANLGMIEQSRGMINQTINLLSN